jgi:hypothetical protein
LNVPVAVGHLQPFGDGPENAVPAPQQLRERLARNAMTSGSGFNNTDILAQSAGQKVPSRSTLAQTLS